MKTDLSVEFCGVKLENPFILAPSPFSEELERVEKALEAGWAGVVLRTTAVESEQVSRVYPFVTRVEDESGHLIGLENLDLISEQHIEEMVERIKILKKRYPSKGIAASIMANKKEDWQFLARRFEQAGADWLECSYSCPHGTEWYLNTNEKGIVNAEEIVRWVTETVNDLPVVLKISAQAQDVSNIAHATKRVGGSGVCAINTLKGIPGVDLKTLIPKPNIGGLSTFGGLSGPAIKPIALRSTAEIARRVDIDISASGGISTWQDGVEFLLLGAKSLQVCTAVLRFGPNIIHGILAGLKNWMWENNFQTISDFYGRSLNYLVDHTHLPRGIQMVAQIDTERCAICHQCFTVCSSSGFGGIEVADKIPRVNTDYCKGCGLCMATCPSRAIVMKRYHGFISRL